METDSINKQGESITEKKIGYRVAKFILNLNPVGVSEIKQGDFTLKLDDSDNIGRLKPPQAPRSEEEAPSILRRKDSTRILELDIKKCGIMAKDSGKTIVSHISLNDTHTETKGATLAAWDVIHRKTQWTLCVHSDTPEALFLVNEISTNRVEVRLTIKTTAPDQWDEEAVKELSAVSEKGYKISVVLAPCHPMKDWKGSLETVFEHLPELRQVWADCKAITKKERNKNVSAFNRDKAKRLFYEALADVAGKRGIKLHFIFGHGSRSHWWARQKGIVPVIAIGPTTPSALADDIHHYLKDENGDAAPSKATITALLGRLVKCRKASVAECEAFHELCHLGSNAEQKLKDKRRHFFILCRKYWNYSNSHLYRLHDAGAVLNALAQKDATVSQPTHVAHVTALLLLEKLEDQVDCWIWIAKTLPSEKLGKTEIEKEVLLYADREHKKLKKKTGSGRVASSGAPPTREDLAEILDKVKQAYPTHLELHNRLKSVEDLLATLPAPGHQPEEKKNEAVTATEAPTEEADLSKGEKPEVTITPPMNGNSEAAPESDEALQTPSLL